MQFHFHRPRTLIIRLVAFSFGSNKIEQFEMNLITEWKLCGNLINIDRMEFEILSSTVPFASKCLIEFEFE